MDGAVNCDTPGSGGWCRGGASLSLSSNEPVGGESIFALEGTHNGTPFYCDGGSCGLPLVEGGNDFSFWAHLYLRRHLADGLGLRLAGRRRSVAGRLDLRGRWRQRLVRQRRDHHGLGQRSFARLRTGQSGYPKSTGAGGSPMAVRSPWAKGATTLTCEP